MQKVAPVDPQEIAIAILGWLANEADMLGRFLALSGVAPVDLRAHMADAGFQAGLLDFVMQDEPSLMAFCEASGFAPEAVATAWNRLSGPGLASGEY